MSTAAADVSALATSIAGDAPSPSTHQLPSLTGAGPEDGAGDINNPSSDSTNTSGLAGERDSNGVLWDAAKHSPGKSKRMDGSWRARKGAGEGRKASALNLPSPPPGPPPHASDAVALDNMVTGLCITMLGDEWRSAPEESIGRVEALRLYLESVGGFNMPPWAGVTLAYLMYGAARFRLPKTKERTAGIREKASSWWKKTRERFAKKRTKVANNQNNAGDAKAPVSASTVDLPPGAEPGFDPTKRKLM